MNEVLTIRAHARQSVDQFDLHGIHPQPPQGLDGDALKDWIAEYYTYGAQRSAKRGGAVMALVSAE